MMLLKQRRDGFAQPAAVLLWALALLWPAVGVSASWWNGEWKFRKEIAFDLSPAGADIAGSPQGVPVLVRLSLANFNYFTDAKPDGSDFRVLAGDDRTPLKFHIERYDAQNQMAFLWIGVPRITGGSKSDKVFLYYGNPDATAASDGPGTYDADQTLVLHFAEPSGLPQDSSAYKNNSSASNAEIVAASLIAGSAKFSGAQVISVPATSTLRLVPNLGFTGSAWVKIDAPQTQGIVLAIADQAHELALGVDGAHAYVHYVGASAPIRIEQSGGDLSAGSWHHLAVTAAAGQITLFVDGVAAGNVPAQLVEIGGTLTVGGSSHGTNYLGGEIDEVEVSKVGRPAEWIKAAAKSQGQDGPLVVYGADGQKEGGQGSYFGTIAKNLTVDGWVVIVICMTMLAVALVVIVLKILYLNRVERANRKFLADFRRLSGDTAALDSGDSADVDELDDDAPMMAALAGEEGKYGASTLYRLYHVGVLELNKRLTGQAAGAQRATILSAQSMEAIRAAIDATSTRLQQRLSAQMVLLTIAISGGPFLGLLGTVIGVMITFAAIAASGDVNVNAIAPGTAAALAATVAGLSVAIPSLFGYNWLNTRIKAINADDRVFVDEFVARVAEQYS
jgi:biopolymer transport protein ExbB